MKRFCLAFLALALAAGAQTTTPPPVTITPDTNPALPSQVFGALVFYNPGNQHKVNGSIFAAIPFPNAPAGTYVYNAVDVLSAGHGQIMTVPTVGFAQHLVWLTPKVELFGLLSGGISVQPSNPTPGTTVTAAFGGGGGLNIAVGKNFYVPLVMKVMQAGGANTLVGGIGVSWGR